MKRAPRRNTAIHFLHQLVGIAALLSGGFRQFRFNFGREMDIHVFRLIRPFSARSGDSLRSVVLAPLPHHALRGGRLQAIR